MTKQLHDYYEDEDYFQLKSTFEANQRLLKKKYRIYFNALTENAFYQHEASNANISKLLKRFENRLSETEMRNVYKTKYMNHHNLYNYNGALASCNLLINNYQHLIDTPAYEHLLNERKILQALIETPAQEVVKPSDCGINLITDKMRLVNIPVTVKDTVLNMLFDTGSSFSFIRRSIAENLGIEILKVDFEVEGITGNVVVCDLAVVKELFLGSIIVKNSVFWVFDDKDLTLPDYDYSVNGAIAFPILKSLGEFHVLQNDSVFIPMEEHTYGYQNLAIDDLDPVISVVIENDTMPWYFDTGAAFSSFYKPYYTMHSEKIDSTCEKHTYNIGGLGGSKEFTSYIIDSVNLKVAESSATISGIEVHTASLYKDPEKVYGNLGQDYIFQFDKMVISTHSASLFFENSE
ncbi:MAG: retropepsin-like aspartic protease [Bacteroidales bacterium]